MAGRPYLVTGSGSGKTLFGLTFLIEGVRRGEVFLVAVDKPPGSDENVRSLACGTSRPSRPSMRTPERAASTATWRSRNPQAVNDLKAMRDVSIEGKQSSDTEDIAIQGIQLKLRRADPSVRSGGSSWIQIEQGKVSGGSP